MSVRLSPRCGEKEDRIRYRGNHVEPPGQAEEGLHHAVLISSRDRVRKDCVLDKFGALLMPVLAEIGMDAKPDVYQAHTFVSA